MRKSDRMWTVILFGIMGIVCGVISPADAAPEVLNISTVAAIGQEPPPMPVIVGPKTLTFSVPEIGHSLSLVGRLGEKINALWKLNLNMASNSAVVSLISRGGAPPINETWMIRNDTTAMAQVSSPDVFMTLTAALPGPEKNCLAMPYFLKPNLNFYVSAERAEVAARYPQFPSALTHAFTVRLEHTESGMALWLDGRFLGNVPPSAGMMTGSVVLAASNELIKAYAGPALQTDSYLPLDLAPYARPGQYRFLSEISGLKSSAMNTVEKIPFFCVESKRNIDVGLSRWLEESVGAGYCDNDTTRSAFFGCPESIILQVPKENYIAAHVLCAVEPSTNKVPVLTLRVTRFGRHYGDSGGRCNEAFADTTMILPGTTNDPLPANVIRVGEIKAGGLTLGDPEQTLPVYLVTVPLKMGEIPDLLGNQAPDFDRGNQYWDLELTKAIRLRGNSRKPTGLLPSSAVHVFGLTLERNPVDVQVMAKESGNIFYAADNPEFNVRFTNTRNVKADLTMSWEITDYYGRKTRQSTRVVVPGRAENGGVADGRIPLSLPALGYFDAVITVTEDWSGRELWRQPTSFALLPPDTRKAGAESPFGTWWFCQTHGSCPKLEVMGPILMKMGMRHVCPQGADKYAESNLAPYKLSYSMVNWHGLKSEADVDAFVQKNPNIRFGMIFHENGISDGEKDYPYPELLGKPKPELTPKGKEEFDKLWKQGEERGLLYRTKYPNIKITVGNTHSPLIVQLIRHGFPKKYIDCIGIEGVAGATTTECQPEHSMVQEIWWIREIQRIYGYDDISVSSGYEYITRGTQLGSGLTEREQADYYVRDALHCLAYGYLSINIGATEDWADSYNATCYGGGGFVRRNPLLTPKPSYVAWATMTRLLDSSKYVRYLDAGSHSLYALEFRRENAWVYPLWTVRGKRQLTATLGGLGGGKMAVMRDYVMAWLTDAGIVGGRNEVSLTDGMGNTAQLSPKGGKIAFEATTSPMYLVTSRKITQISPEKAIHEEKPPANPLVISDFSDPAAWDMEEKNPGMNVGGNPAVVGKFTLAPVADPEKGNVTELTLEPQLDVAKITSRCVFLKLKTPVTIRLNVKRLGIWVKGNSCWGGVDFEFMDAKGAVYKTKHQFWDFNKFFYKLAINFDGWCFISQDLPVRITDEFRNPDISLLQYQRNINKGWAQTGGDKDGIVQFPITVTRVAVAMRDWQVYVTDMIPSQTRSIRLGGLLAGD